MRFFLTVTLMLFFFTANQVAASSFEHCTDLTCTESQSIVKKAEDSKDPCCPSHCAVGHSHNLAIQQTAGIILPASITAVPVWAKGAMPESATLEGLIEPPSFA